MTVSFEGDKALRLVKQSLSKALRRSFPVAQVRPKPRTKQFIVQQGGVRNITSASEQYLVEIDPQVQPTTAFKPLLTYPRRQTRGLYT